MVLFLLFDDKPTSFLLFHNLQGGTSGWAPWRIGMKIMNLETLSLFSLDPKVCCMAIASPGSSILRYFHQFCLLAYMVWKKLTCLCNCCCISWVLLRRMEIFGCFKHQKPCTWFCDHLIKICIFFHLNCFLDITVLVQSFKSFFPLFEGVNLFFWNKEMTMAGY